MTAFLEYFALFDLMILGAIAILVLLSFYKTEA